MTTFEQLLEIAAGEQDDFSLEYEMLIDSLYDYFCDSGEVDYETVKYGDKFEWIPEKIQSMCEFDINSIAIRLDTM